MAEQDTSKWELDNLNRFYDYSGRERSIGIDVVDNHGIWVELYTNDSSDRWHTWIPPEVAEAMGTMLLYAAQEWRLKHGDTDPR